MSRAPTTTQQDVHYESASASVKTRQTQNCAEKSTALEAKTAQRRIDARQYARFLQRKRFKKKRFRRGDKNAVAPQLHGAAKPSGPQKATCANETTAKKQEHRSARSECRSQERQTRTTNTLTRSNTITQASLNDREANSGHGLRKSNGRAESHNVESSAKRIVNGYHNKIH